MTKLTIKDWSELVRFKVTPMVQRGHRTLEPMDHLANAQGLATFEKHCQWISL